MKSDLKNLANKQELYYQNSYSYTTVQASLAFETSSGVTVASAATISGWSASATHTATGTSEGCVVFFGTATTPTVGPTTAAAAGAVSCTR
jgi:hypothetical protein